MMKLGFFLYGTGHHIASWRDPDVQADANRSLRHYIDITQTAERALFDFVFNADSNSSFGPDDPEIWQRKTDAMRLEPLTLLGALSAVTSHIGLISTATTTYLDQMSGGRVGWNVVTSSAASEAFNFSHDKHAAHDDRYRRAAEFIQVAQGLWDTWEDDAFVMDKAQGLFFHPTKMHMLHHKGEHFSVRGPLPDVPLSNTQQGRQKMVVEMARSENLTIRQLYKRVATARGHRVALGTAADIADALEEWYRGNAADGFNIMPQVFPAGVNEFGDLVIPELQRRGLFRTKYEGKTLRENVGLPRPKNRFVASDIAAE